MILHLYFARRFLWMFLSVFGIFALFQGMLDLIEEMRRFDDTVSFGQVLQVVLMKLPAGMYEIIPLVMILATIALFIGLARSSELVVTRAAGRSGVVALMAPATVALILGGLIVALLNPIVSATSKRYTELREIYENGSAAALSIGPEGLWLRQGGQDGPAVIHAARANAEATELFDVSIVVYAPGGGPATRIVADAARLEDGYWVLNTAKAWPLTAGLNPEAGAREHEELRLASSLTQDSIRDRFGKPSAVAIWDLPAFIDGLEESGFSARRYVVWLHMELSRPLFLVAMTLLGAAFTMRPTRLGRTGIAILSAVLLGFGLYYVRSFAQIMGENGQLAPLIAAWVPPVASVLLALGLVLHMEDG
ncbi:LPS export ABC transporter permease LptG [Mameliella alba]|nr:LPS export ABC transporter permease LptG [Antarctobacter heliothermus]MBY6145677.1 LPS export ABC transporter permease LptG [Mameliella alba]MBY6161000.1 LPS export ABC transporter permease LptG [Mameliella alba]MBY6169470.1 LPS export ABC transporter permease LptG [Mameliella alba]MBY6174489.1 LPS export ABC transporter permease LptG [Mameliella alba]